MEFVPACTEIRCKTDAPNLTDLLPSRPSRRARLEEVGGLLLADELLEGPRQRGARPAVAAHLPERGGSVAELRRWWNPRTLRVASNPAHPQSGRSKLSTPFQVPRRTKGTKLDEHA